MQYGTPGMAGKHLLACQWVLFVYVGRAAAAPSTAAAASACVLCGAHRVIGRCTQPAGPISFEDSVSLLYHVQCCFHFVLCGMLTAVEPVARAALKCCKLYEQLS